MVRKSRYVRVCDTCGDTIHKGDMYWRFFDGWGRLYLNSLCKRCTIEAFNKMLIKLKGGRYGKSHINII